MKNRRTLLTLSVMLLSPYYLSACSASDTTDSSSESSSASSSSTTSDDTTSTTTQSDNADAATNQDAAADEQGDSVGPDGQTRADESDADNPSADSESNIESDAADDTTIEQSDDDATGLDEADAATSSGDDPEELYASLFEHCNDLCGDISADCGPNAASLFPDGPCVDTCMEDVQEDLAWFISYSCLVETCDVDACFGDEPPPLNPSCIAFCDELDACGFKELLGIPLVPEEACAIGCSDEFFPEEITDCLSAAVKNDCDMNAATECLMFEGGDGMGDMPNCYEFCHQTLGAPFESMCMPWNPIYDTWADASECVEFCEGLKSPQAETAFVICVSQAWCGDVSGCLAMGGSMDPICEAACDALVETCPNSIEAMGSSSQCAAYCTGELAGFGGEAQESAVACIEAITDCELVEMAGPNFLQSCVLDFTGPCTTFCQSSTDCMGSMGGGDEMSSEEQYDMCYNECSQGIGMPAWMLIPVSDCMALSVGDCDAQEKCWDFMGGGTAGASICQQKCFYGSGACMEPWEDCSGMVCEVDWEACTAECETGLEDGDDEALWKVACDMAGECSGPQCDEDVTEDIETACESACDDDDDATCGDYDGGCETVCQGVLQGLGTFHPIMSDCLTSEVLKTLGIGCNLSNIAWATDSCALPPCYQKCDGSEACGLDVEACVDTCEHDIDTEINGGLAKVACDAMSGCDEETCATPTTETGLASCTAACAQTGDDTCGEVTGGCVQACAGALVGLDFVDDYTAECIAWNLGWSCDLSHLAEWCGMMPPPPGP